MGYSLSGTDCTSLAPPRSAGPARKSAPAWTPLHWLQLPSGHIQLLRHGVLHGLQVDICSTVLPCGLQEDKLHHRGVLHGLQGNVCSHTWSTSSHSFNDLSAGLFLLYFSHSLLTAAAHFFYPFSNMLSQRHCSIIDSLRFGQQLVNFSTD